MNSRPIGWTCTIAATVIAVGACAPIQAPPPDPAMGMFTGVALPGGPLNQLPRAVLRALAMQVTWEGCVTAPRTGTTTAPTNIRICAASYARNLGQGNTTATGVLTARMINLGPTSDARWRLTRYDTSYIVSFPSTPTQGGYAILEVPSNTVPGTTVRVVKQNGIFVYCPHGQPNSTSSASFYTCARKAAAHSRSRGSGTGSGPSAEDEVLVQDLDGPAWVSCMAGCCTTDAL